jgi:excinuclease ABC subunit B
MQRAIEETGRRRHKQVAFNQEHGITPRSVQKKVHDIMEGAYPGAPGSPKQYAKVAEEVLEYAALSPAKLGKKIKQLEQKMFQHAQNLEFEEAAHLRDEIKQLREHAMGMVETKAV